MGQAIYWILAMALLRWISSLVSLAVVESLRMIPSSILVECQKIPVGIAGVAFVGVDFLYRLFGMTTLNRAIGQKGGVVHRGRCEGGGQDKAVFGIHRGVFLETKVRGIVTNGPVGFKIPGKLQRPRLVTNPLE